MIISELTKSHWAARYQSMWVQQHNSRWFGRRAVCAGLLLAGGLTLTGCISVSAPDKPIVIELNFNVKQEVSYKLAPDVANTIEKNSEIF
jgi:YnbE-like lipoprotein